MIDNSTLLKLQMNLLVAEKATYLLREKLGINADVPKKLKMKEKKVVNYGRLIRV